MRNTQGKLNGLPNAKIKLQYFGYATSHIQARAPQQPPTRGAETQMTARQAALSAKLHGLFLYVPVDRSILNRGIVKTRMQQNRNAGIYELRRFLVALREKESNDKICHQDRGWCDPANRASQVSPNGKCPEDHARYSIIWQTNMLREPGGYFFCAHANVTGHLNEGRLSWCVLGCICHFLTLKGHQRENKWSAYIVAAT